MTTFQWVSAAAPLPVRPMREKRLWVRVSKHEPCPVCGHPDWCSVSECGEAALCMRVMEGAANSVTMGHGEGYIHELNQSFTPRPAYSFAPVRKPITLDCAAIVSRWQQAAYPGQSDLLAMDLGVSAEAVQRLGAVWAEKYKAWAFPMSDARRNIVGIRLRSPQGKWAVRWSEAGIFLPSGIELRRKPLLICEGPTDTAAALTLGYPAIGRPSCSGGIEIISEILEKGRRVDVVVVADQGGPGQYGATRFADRIVGICRSVKVVTPPAKDIRAWLNQGATAEDFEQLMRTTNYHHGAQPCR